VTGTATANDNATPKTATASCDAGKVVLGGGYHIGGTSTQTASIASYPISNDTWVATAIKITGNPSFSIQAFVICATQ
jgi:hypothetical protein